MWLMTKHGFYSIVQKKPGEFHIRSRVRKDLENLVERVPLTGTKIHDTTGADYSFRVIVGKDEVSLSHGVPGQHPRVLEL